MIGIWKIHEAVAPRRSLRWAVSDRGWLFAGSEDKARGYYLDYGPDHYRSPHEYCRGACECRDSQAGNVLAVVVSPKRESRWLETTHAARQWIASRQCDLANVIGSYEREVRA